VVPSPDAQNSLLKEPGLEDTTALDFQKALVAKIAAGARYDRFG
jgi:hypothetical protein